MKITKTISLLAVAFAMTGASTAFAQDPASEVYNPNGGVLDVVASGTPTPTPTPAATTAPDTSSGTAPETSSSAPTKSSTSPSTSTAPATASTPAATPSTETEQASTGSLPFTGFEAGFVGIAGLALLAGGFAMRRMTRDDS